MDIKNFTDVFFEKYGNRSDKPVLFFSPGRVNLIGEHTDYNGGFVPDFYQPEIGNGAGRIG